MANLRAHISGDNPDSAKTQGAAPDLLPDKDAGTKSEIHHIEEPREARPGPGMEAPRSGVGILIFATIMALFWVGAAMAYLWGYFGQDSASRIDAQLIGFAVAMTFLPPLLFIGAGFAFARALTLSDTARQLAFVSDRLTEADDTAADNAQRVGRTVRRELDALSAGLDTAFTRFRALETALEDRIAQLNDASARAGVKAETIAQRLNAERERIEDLASELEGASARAAETLAGRTAQLKLMIEDAGSALQAVGQTLDSQVAQFRQAAENAVHAPQAVATELDRQAQQIENAGEAAAARAEFVLARQERQRVAMGELSTRLKEEGEGLERALQAQRDAVERATGALSQSAAQVNETAGAGLARIDAAMTSTGTALAGQAQKLNEIAEHGLRRLDAALVNAASRSTQLTVGFGNDAARIKKISEDAIADVARLVDSLRESTLSAGALLADSTESAKKRSVDFVGEAMAQSDRLLRAAALVAEEVEKARASLARAVEDAERHMVALPGIAQQEAQRVRETLRAETEQVLDMSARAITTLQNRSSSRRPAPEPMQIPGEPPIPETQPEGLRGLARRLTGSRRRPEPKIERPKDAYELSAVLAAAEAGGKPGLRPGAVASLAALQAALADLAGDLEDLAGETSDPVLWRRYLDGDRGVFARRLAGSIGPETVNRITELYRENPRFHDAAEGYMAEFEQLLARAREGDRDGFLASTLLTADTGKIYLAIAYALGRLE